VGDAVNGQKSGSQNLVAPDDVAQRLSQRLDVQRAAQAIGVCHVVGWAIRQQLIQKP